MDIVRRTLNLRSHRQLKDEDSLLSDTPPKSKRSLGGGKLENLLRGGRTLVPRFKDKRNYAPLGTPGSTDVHHLEVQKQTKGGVPPNKNRGVLPLETSIRELAGQGLLTDDEVAVVLSLSPQHQAFCLTEDGRDMLRAAKNGVSQLNWDAFRRISPELLPKA
jgi:hypothetical protein